MLPTIAEHALPRDFRRIADDHARVVLLEGGPRVLSTYPDALSEHARRDLAALGVEVRTGALVTGVERGMVRVGDDEIIRSHTVIWAAGNAASPLGKSLGVPLDRVGRVLVEPDLTVPGHPELFVVGDMAAIETDGRPVPGVAPAAMQMGDARGAVHPARSRAARTRRRSATATRATSRPSAGTARSRTSDGCSSRGAWRGGSGSSSTSSISRASATGSAC